MHLSATMLSKTIMTTSVTTGRIHLELLCNLCRAACGTCAEFLLIFTKLVESWMKLHQNGAKSQYTQPVVTDVVTTGLAAHLPNF